MNLPAYFVRKALAGQPSYYLSTPRGHFSVEDDNRGPCVWTYKTPSGAKKREIRAMIVDAFMRRDGTPAKITGTYPRYQVTY